MGFRIVNLSVKKVDNSGMVRSNHKSRLPDLRANKSVPSIIRVKFAMMDSKLLKMEMESFGFAEEEEDIIYRWIDGNFSFLKK